MADQVTTAIVVGSCVGVVCIAIILTIYFCKKGDGCCPTKRKSKSLITDYAHMHDIDDSTPRMKKKRSPISDGHRKDSTSEESVTYKKIEIERKDLDAKLYLIVARSIDSKIVSVGMEYCEENSMSEEMEYSNSLDERKKGAPKKRKFIYSTNDLLNQMKLAVQQHSIEGPVRAHLEKKDSAKRPKSKLRYRSPQYFRITYHNKTVTVFSRDDMYNDLILPAAAKGIRDLPPAIRNSYDTFKLGPKLFSNSDLEKENFATKPKQECSWMTLNTSDQNDMTDKGNGITNEIDMMTNNTQDKQIATEDLTQENISKSRRRSKSKKSTKSSRVSFPDNLQKVKLNKPVS